MTRMLLVDLVPVLGAGYLAEIRSCARRGVRMALSRDRTRSAVGREYSVAWAVMAVTVIALVLVAPGGHLVSAVAIGNLVAVLVVMELVRVGAALLHNRTRARR